ncbi:MAG: enamine deaminase RidA (YjgF/YER057c/UK114 family) [Roseivirga sp.]|jgi:enamine deaminase RidA (YjgF/YER057c/UK114 family)
MEKLNKTKRMSQIVIHGDTIYLAGQIPADTNQKMKTQTESVLSKIDDLLATAGSDKSKLLMATIYISDKAQVAEMNEAWDAWVDPENPPARACVETQFPRDGLLVEIVVTAAK